MEVDYVRLLLMHDDPIQLEAPSNFDYAAAVAQFKEFFSTASQELGIPLRAETESFIQDASFHSQILLPVGGEPAPSIRFSNFGGMVTVTEAEKIPSETLEEIKALLKRHDYTYVPIHVLQQGYNGTNSGIDGIPDWFTRYFSWV